MTVTVLPIDFDLHLDTCVNFRVDSFVASFGSADRFYQECGADGAGYVEWLKLKAAKDPRCCVHVWLGDKIIGQIEMGLMKDNPSIGNVNLMYLAPDYRGKGFSKHIQEYVQTYMRTIGIKRARLNVSPTNLRALKFYQKHGWVDIGPRPGHSHVHIMELIID